MTREDHLTRMDRMRYTKDTLSSGLVLLAIVLDALYFVSIYKTDVGSYYYTWTIGASIIFNLVFLLAAFLSSEGVKNRSKGYFVPLLILGVLQICRVFYLPAKAYAATVTIAGVETPVMEQSQYLFTVICLAVSGLFCIAAAVISAINNVSLDRYLRSMEQEEVK